MSTEAYCAPYPVAANIREVELGAFAKAEEAFCEPLPENGLQKPRCSGSSL